MKERKVKDKDTGARTLIVRGTRGEQLDYERAEWLAVRPSPLLLPFKYEIGKRRFLFYYDVTGLPTLREYLAMGISGSQYVLLLLSLGELGDLCSSADLPMEMVRFEPENIYVSDGRMLFCCLPLKPAVQQVSVLDLLKVLADPAKVKFVLPDDRRLAELTMDFVRRSRVFSAFDFDEFLARGFNAGAVSSVSRDSVSGNLSARQGASNVVFDPFAGSEVDEQASVAQSLSRESSAGAAARLGDAVVGGGSNRLVQPSVMSSVGDACAKGVHGSEQRGGSAFDSGTQALSGVLKETPDTMVDSVGDASLPLKGAGGGGSGSLGDPSCSVSSVSSRHASFVPFVVVRDRDGSRLCMAAGEVVIGRSSRCEARITGNTNISRIHAVVRDSGDGTFSVSDLGSANGTTVRGRVLGRDETLTIVRGERFDVADETLHIE